MPKDAGIQFDAATCPLPQSDYEHVLLGHGSGGRMSADLLQRTFLPRLGNDILSALEDQAVVSLHEDNRNGARLAFTTDSFVVRPIFFPGGDIGRLAVNGTVNDLAVGGALPLFLSAAFILEEGLPIRDLERIADSIRAACDETGVTLATADTKVVDRGKGDQIFITTTGIGIVQETCRLSIHAARPGDRLIVSGTIGDHGIAIMSVREGIEFETVLESDTAPLTGLAQTLLAAGYPPGAGVRAMRDPTRGGLSSAVHELARASHVGVKLVESAIPIRASVRAACEMLGLDPVYVANEGKLIAVVDPDQAEEAVRALRSHPLGRDAAIIGHVVEEHPGMVTMKSALGSERIVTMLAAEQLPRIC